MSFEPITIALDIGNKLIDRLWPDPAKAAAAKLELLKLQQSGELQLMVGQLEINKVEAAHPSLFVSGWRPAVGWACTIGLVMQFVIAPLILWVSALFGQPILLPPLDMSILVSMLGGMLGIGGLRTIEKLNSVDRK